MFRDWSPLIIQTQEVLTPKPNREGDLVHLKPLRDQDSHLELLIPTLKVHNND